MVYVVVACIDAVKNSCVCFKEGRDEVGNLGRLIVVAYCFLLGPSAAYPVENGIVTFGMHRIKRLSNESINRSAGQCITFEFSVAIHH